MNALSLTHIVLTQALMASLYPMMGLASMLPPPNGIFGCPMCACPLESKWFFANVNRYNVGHRNECVPSNPCLLGSPWWGEINREKSGCGGNEQKKKCEKGWKWVKLGENPKMPYPQMWKKHQNLLSDNNDAPGITKYGSLI